MALDWSLEEIYSSFDSSKFKNDLKRIDDKINSFISIVNNAVINHNNEKEKLEEYLFKLEELELLFIKLSSFTQLTVSVNAKDVVANKYSDILSSKWAKMTEPITKMSKWISKINNINILINSSGILTEHSFFIEETIENSKHMLGEKEENIIARLKTTGSESWVNYKNLLVSTHKVKIVVDGEEKEIPLTEVLNMAYSSDSDLRKRAYEAEIDSYKSIENGIAAALNGIKGEVLTVSDLKGYDSPLEMTLNSSRMDKEILDTMLEAIKESLPVFRKYLKRKAEMLGYKKGLPFYDLYAPVTKMESSFTFEEGKSFVEKNFRSFSENLGNFAVKAFEKNWIDVKPKEGKVGGAFCASIKTIGESRILLNYGDSFSDVVTMAHELGHGFHNECLKNETSLNSDCPMTLAETASNFCEVIVKNGAIKTASDDEAFVILENEISDCTQVIVDIYSRYLFETKVFDERKESSLSVDEIKEIMINAQKEAYGDGLDEEYLHPYMWTWKPHYYYADSNFYNFPYAFGNLFAKGLYSEYISRGESFSKEYEKLLSVTGKLKVSDVTKIMNIDVTNIDFWRGSLKIIEKDIDKFIELSYKING